MLAAYLVGLFSHDITDKAVVSNILFRPSDIVIVKNEMVTDPSWFYCNANMSAND